MNLVNNLEYKKAKVANALAFLGGFRTAKKISSFSLMEVSEVEEVMLDLMNSGIVGIFGYEYFLTDLGKEALEGGATG